jgi:hypothetical protein
MESLTKIVPEHKDRERILEPPFRLGVIGGSGSGKSFLIARMLVSDKPHLYKTFRKVFWCNPTLGNTEANDPYSVIKVDKENCYDTMNDDVLRDILNKLPRSKKTDEIRPSLLIIDDCGELSKNNEFARKLFIRIRHSNMSCILSVQKSHMIPPSVRQSLSHLCLMSATNQKQTDDIIEEFFPVSGKEAKTIMAKAFEPDEETERPFLFMDLTKGRIFKRLPALEWLK